MTTVQITLPDFLAQEATKAEPLAPLTPEEISMQHPPEAAGPVPDASHVSSPSRYSTPDWLLRSPPCWRTTRLNIRRPDTIPREGRRR